MAPSQEAAAKQNERPERQEVEEGRKGRRLQEGRKGRRMQRAGKTEGCRGPERQEKRPGKAGGIEKYARLQLAEGRVLLWKRRWIGRFGGEGAGGVRRGCETGCIRWDAARLYGSWPGLIAGGFCLVDGVVVVVFRHRNSPTPATVHVGVEDTGIET